MIVRIQRFDGRSKAVGCSRFRLIVALTIACLGICSSCIAATEHIGVEPEESGVYGPRNATRWAFTFFDVKLSQVPSCNAAGSHPDDQTIGDYLAGFLSSMDRDTNRIEASCQVIDPLKALYQCAFWMKHQDEEDEWAWGIDFMVAGEKPVRSSLRCVGSG